MNFRESAEYIDRTGMFGIKLGLEQTERLFELGGLDSKKVRFIHIAGTNGKGSVGAMLQQMLRTAGYKVGFYTSPHLISVRERFRVNGRAITEERFAELATRLVPAAERMKLEGAGPTYFELTTALALAFFIDEKVDFAVWETGMGGRLDATNAVTPEAAVITNIAMDHMQYLGDTLAKIAGEKAGIIKPRVPVFAGTMPKGALEVIRRKAAELDAPFEQSGSAPCHNIELPLTGAMQKRNFALAEKVMEYLAGKFGFDIESALDGVKHVTWPGRIQQVNAKLWVDGGHNPDGAQALAEALNGRKLSVVFGAFRDKDAARELPFLEKIAAEFVFVPISGHGRACYSCDDLAALTTVPSRPAADVKSAVDSCRGETLVTGSLYLVAEALENFYDADKVLNI
ncbi:MAG: bifunctional folylpolyglutamate synthase/dihydrofolate synthase [Victivallaceae bacterium]|nr:bifunctional folylpolyglutamate synthase/dihydrofolate synthase [Victivallaceae bacterium]